MANLAISKMKCEKINKDNAVIIGTKFGHVNPVYVLCLFLLIRYHTKFIHPSNLQPHQQVLFWFLFL